MNGVNHAATALVLKRYAPESSLSWLLIGTALCDLLWVLLVVSGIEIISYSNEVRSLADIHLLFDTYSHSLLSGVVGGFAIALLVYSWHRKSKTAMAFGIAVFSHIVLDIAVHNYDIPLSWATNSIKLGSGLYGIPVYAFVVEITYLCFCLYIAHSSRRMLYWLLALNVASISLYVPAIPGPEYWFESHPWMFPLLVMLDTLVGIIVIRWIYGKQNYVRE